MPAETAVESEFGEAEAARKNRVREHRLKIVAAFQRLGIPQGRWTAAVRAFANDPTQVIDYHSCLTPLPFQAPEFDRLTQSPEEWMRLADAAWKKHRDGFLQQVEAWVAAGIDEPIETAKRVRGAGEEEVTSDDRKRGRNTSLERRYEWAAQYLLDVPLKEIAWPEGKPAPDGDPSTVGRVAREILRAADWPTK